MVALTLLMLSLAVQQPAPDNVDAQAPHDAAAMAQQPATLLPGMGDLNHPIDTKSEEAQKFFDQGLTLIYAFNHDEAIRSFRRAAELDPASPMPLWGIALALGPNINLDVDPDREKAAYEAAQQALKLAAAGSSAAERAYVNALVKRYSNDPKADLKALAVQYKDAMRDLTIAFPNDLDAATLYAEAIMDLHPWQLWDNDGMPADGTIELVNVLQSVLQRNPNHVGANHYYVHAVEASITPERGIDAASRLAKLVPAAGHLVHMPAHIYMRTGDYAGAVKANEAAVDVDRKYIAATNASGVYPMMYYNHNLDFLASAAMMTGEFAKASKAADEVASNALAGIPHMPELEPYAAKKMFVLLRFAKWDEMLQVPQPDSSLKLMTAVWHFGRGVAQAKKGNAAAAVQERTAYRAAKQQVPGNTPWNLNTAQSIFLVADNVLDARIALAQKNLDESIKAWKRAVDAEDKLKYDEPSDWFYPVRESLAAALLYAHRLDDTERMIREELEKDPENGRILFLRLQLMNVIEDKDMALVARRHLNDAWENADVELKLDDF
jgi:tetratricopeptide (TPR) repeat protein